LTRRRVTLGFVLGAPVLWLAQPTGATLAAGVAIALAGEGVRIWAAGHLAKAQEVTTSGPYRWFAHPLYLGSSIIGVGLAVASASLLVALMIAVYLLATLTASIRSERAFLRSEIASGSPRQRFSLTRAIANHEHRAALGVLAAILLLAWKATYNGSFWR
jgi:hypothetical protein